MAADTPECHDLLAVLRKGLKAAEMGPNADEVWPDMKVVELVEVAIAEVKTLVRQLYLNYPITLLII